MALSGWAAGPPVLPPLGLAARLDAMVDEIEQRARSRGHRVALSWPAALAGRAALLGLSRQGRRSANGSCRLLRTPDGWVALNLPRPEDVDLIPALIEGPVADPWDAVAQYAGGTPASSFVGRARLLGLAAARLAESGERRGAEPAVIIDRWSRQGAGRGGGWHVVDLSSLWAGPVVARILGAAGAVVTRVEDRRRPDGARAEPAFHQWIHSPHEITEVVDLHAAAGRRRAAELIDGADVVIEGSRPRALEQLGLGPDDRPDRPGRVWLSISGHGRQRPNREWVAFGDDAAVAGGLVGSDEMGEPVFCGDAIADPLTGLAGALAVMRALDDGGGQLIDLAMSRVAAFGAKGPQPPESAGLVVTHSAGGWVVQAGGHVEPVRIRPDRLEWIRRG
jgi:hypothetical protein